LHEDDVPQVVFGQEYFTHLPVACYCPHYRSSRNPA
jgi:hypothetical protein